MPCFPFRLADAEKSLFSPDPSYAELFPNSLIISWEATPSRVFTRCGLAGQLFEHPARHDVLVC